MLPLAILPGFPVFSTRYFAADPNASELLNPKPKPFYIKPETTEPMARNSAGQARCPQRGASESPLGNLPMLRDFGLLGSLEFGVSSVGFRV